eukprot:30017-Pelagococcus_subviridis.AAC.27
MCASSCWNLRTRHAKVREPHRELPERPLAVAEHHAVPRAVHRLQSKLFLLDVETEHVLFVVRRVPGRLPQVEVVDVGRDDFAVLVLPVLLFDEVDEVVVNRRAVGKEKARPGGENVEEEQFLVQTQDTVIALLRFLDAKLVLFHELIRRERHGVDANERVLGDVRAPVRARALIHRHSLDPRRVREVRPAAKVDHRAASVARDRRVLGEVRDELDLELVLEEHLQGFVARDFDALKRLLLLDDSLHALLDLRPLVVRKRLIAEVAVVVKPLLDRRTDRQVRAVLELERFAQDVRARVPVQLFALGVVEREQLERAVALERSSHVPVLPVHVREDRRLRELLVDAHRDVPRRRDVLHRVADRAVGHRDLDRLVRRLRGGLPLALAREVFLEELDALRVVRALLFVRGRPGGFLRWGGVRWGDRVGSHFFSDETSGLVFFLQSSPPPRRGSCLAIERASRDATAGVGTTGSARRTFERRSNARGEDGVCPTDRASTRLNLRASSGRSAAELSSGALDEKVVHPSRSFNI